MISDKRVLKILSKGKPVPKNKIWYGEPNLASYYGKKEILHQLILKSKF